jgi:hypothetical protein
MSDDEIKIDFDKIFNELKTDFNKDRYKKFKNNYTVDKVITNLCFFIVILLGIFIASEYHYDLDYFKCETNTPYTQIFIENINNSKDLYCKNIFFTPITWKNLEYLPPGEYGTNPSYAINLFLTGILSIFSVGLLVNHIVYNKRK